MIIPSPSGLDHSNEGDEPGSAFIKSNEQRLLGGHSPIHANIVKRANKVAGTLGGMGGMHLNHNVVFTGTIGKHDWLAESPMNAGGRSGTNHMLPQYDKASSNGVKDVS
jgi:hypothetical protein